MSSKKKSTAIDPEQREMIEKAQERAKQKRRLIQHFILFLIGSVVFIILNAILEYGQDIQPFGLDWFVWAIMIWAVLLFVHTYNVFITNRFLGKDWENSQVERLVAKQRKRIEELEKKVEKEHPVPEKGRRDKDSNPAPKAIPERNQGKIGDQKPHSGNTPEPSHDKPIDPDKPLNS